MDQLFRIVSGVHRCVAAREAGLAGIFAEIMDDDGFMLVGGLVALDCIYSPKPSIDRWDRNRDFLDLVAIMSSVAGRAKIETVTLTPIDFFRSTYLTSLMDVIVTQTGDYQ